MPSSETIGLPRPLRFGMRPTRAVAFLAAITIAAIVASVGALLWQLRERDLNHALLETESAARMLMDQTSQALDGPDMALRALQERLDTPFGRALELDSQAVHLLLAARAHGMRQVKSIFLLDAQGRTMNSSLQHPAPDISAADRDYFRAFAVDGAQGLYVDKVVRGKGDGEWTLHMARRIDDANGRLRCVVVVNLGLLYFERLFDRLTIDFVRPIGLYSADGTLVVSLPHRGGDISRQADELQGVDLPQQAGELRTIVRPRRDGTTLRFAIGRLDGYPLLAGVSDDDVETLATWRETAVMIALSSFVVVLFVMTAAGALVLQLRHDERLSRALLEADDRFQKTLETVMDAIVSVDESQSVVIFNHAAERMFGVAAADIVGKSLGSLLPALSRDTHERYIGHFMAQEEHARAMSPQREVRGRRADGSEFPVESSISATRIRGRMQLTAVLRDITERRQAEAELRALNQELRRLSATLQSVREEERGRISRELHDELGQQLTVIKLDLSWLTMRLKEGRRLEVATLEGMRQKLDAAIVSVRQISSELRPRILDELGFGEAVSWQATEFTRRSGIQADLDLSAANLVKRPELATALFRIVQESLTNVARHSGASRVRIELSNDAHRVCLRVRDDGQGLQAGEGRGIGLLSMRERANALGGSFRVAATPDGGTVVEVSVPIGDVVQVGEQTA